MTEVSGLVDALEVAGSRLEPWLLGLTAWTAALLAAAWVAERLLARRVAARWRMLLYVVVLARLALPVDWTSPLGVAAGDAPTSVEMAPNTRAAGVAAAPVARAAVTVSSPHRLTVRRGGLALAWLVGAFVVLAIGLVGRLRLARLLRHATPADLPPGMPSPRARVLVHESLGPAVVGVVRPLIVLPRGLLATIAPAALSRVLRHEEAHVDRHDPWLVLGLHVLLAAAWPVVPVWLAARRLRALCEEACDDRALMTADADERREYGRTLLAVAERAVERPRLALGLLPFGSALASRLSALRFARRWPAAVQASLVVAASAGLLAAAGVRELAANTVLETSPAVAAFPKLELIVHPRVPLEQAPELHETLARSRRFDGVDHIVAFSRWLDAVRATDAWTESLQASGSKGWRHRKAFESALQLDENGRETRKITWRAEVPPAETLLLAFRGGRMQADGALVLGVTARAWTGEAVDVVSSSISIGLRAGETMGLLVPGGEGGEAFAHVVTVTWPDARITEPVSVVEHASRLSPTLNASFSTNFRERSLRDVARIFRDITSVTMSLQPGVDPDRRINLETPDLPFLDVLERLGRQEHLSFRVIDESTIEVRNMQDAEPGSATTAMSWSFRDPNGVLFTVRVVGEPDGAEAHSRAVEAQVPGGPEFTSLGFSVTNPEDAEEDYAYSPQRVTVTAIDRSGWRYGSLRFTAPRSLTDGLDRLDARAQPLSAARRSMSDMNLAPGTTWVSVLSFRSALAPAEIASVHLTLVDQAGDKVPVSAVR